MIECIYVMDGQENELMSGKISADVRVFETERVNGKESRDRLD